MDVARGNGLVREAAAGRTVVVIPTLDEEQSIAEGVRSIPRAIVSRVIVADGGSSHATVARAKAAGADVIDAGRGYGRACPAGARNARADLWMEYRNANARGASGAAHSTITANSETLT